MYQIIDFRDTGKTKELLTFAKDQHASIVCKNPVAMIEKAKRYGIVGVKAYSYQEFWRYVIPCQEAIVIDELEECLMEGPNDNLLGYNLTIT